MSVIHTSSQPKVAIQVLRMPEIDWHPPITESDDIVFHQRSPASDRALIGQARYNAYLDAIESGYEYVGWIDDDDFTNPFYFTNLLSIIERNPNMDAITSLQGTYFNDIKENVYPKTTGEIVHANSYNYHGPCIYRSSSLIKGLDILEHFVGYDENRVLAKHMIELNYNLYLWDSYETFLVRNYSECKKRVDDLIKERYG